MPGRALILSSSADAKNFAVVARGLRAGGFDVIELLSDEVLSGQTKLSAEFQDGAWRMSVGGSPAFSPGDVDAAWWRKPQWAGVVRDDPAQRLSLELELERMHLALASLVPARAWLNSPTAMRAAESKLWQMQVAADHGFRCPHGLVTNDWDAARRILDHENVVFKALRGGIRRGGEDRVVFTTKVDLGTVDGQAGHPYPGILQEQISRAREWRITVVGSRIFPVAVHVPPGGVDWRRDQLRGEAVFAAEEVEPAVEEALASLVAGLGLRYAAVDLIEEPDGTMVFLEANPNGQYAWLEEELGLPISAAIASTLEAGAG
jgi:glutathione synthase/RimK-type ligase-like ATP-grasp enzyme